MVYAFASVLTLKVIVCPTFTLISVANPWMVGSPAPLTSHWLGGFPGRQFSASIGFAGALQFCPKAAEEKPKHTRTTHRKAKERTRVFIVFSPTRVDQQNPTEVRVAVFS